MSQGKRAARIRIRIGFGGMGMEISAMATEAALRRSFAMPEALGLDADEAMVAMGEAFAAALARRARAAAMGNGADACLMIGAPGEADEDAGMARRFWEGVGRNVFFASKAEDLMDRSRREMEGGAMFLVEKEAHFKSRLGGMGFMAALELGCQAWSEALRWAHGVLGVGSRIRMDAMTVRSDAWASAEQKEDPEAGLAFGKAFAAAEGLIETGLDPKAFTDWTGLAAERKMTANEIFPVLFAQEEAALISGAMGAMELAGRGAAQDGWGAPRL